MAVSANTRLALSAAGVMLLASLATWAILQRRAAPPAEPLPAKDLYTAAEIHEQFTLQKITPLDNPRLYFEVLAPKDWSLRPLTVTPAQLVADADTPVPLAQLGPRPGQNVLMEAHYIRVPPQVTLARFVTVYAERAGFAIVARQHGTYNGHDVEDALLRRVAPGLGPTLTRLTAARRGGLVFFLSSSCKEDDYPRWKRVFGAGALSFDPRGK